MIEILIVVLLMARERQTTGLNRNGDELWRFCLFFLNCLVLRWGLTLHCILIEG